MTRSAWPQDDDLLWRCLAPVSPETGFYIDVGASDPDIGSATKIWYDYGWQGINLEPSPVEFGRLQRERPRDINIQAAAADAPGRITIHEVDRHRPGTMVGTLADRHAAAAMSRTSHMVDAVTLTDICERHAPAQIHFLRVNGRGREVAVLRGMDLARFRPWVLVIETGEPRGIGVATDEECDRLVRDSGYVFAATRTANRYYVAPEHPELLDAFARPVDDDVRGREGRRVAALEAELLEARDRIGARRSV